MAVIVGQRRREQDPSPHDVVSRQCNEHGMLDTVVKCIAVTNAFERKPCDRWDKFGQPGVRGPKPAFHVGRQKRAQGVGCQFGNRDHETQPCGTVQLAVATYLGHGQGPQAGVPLTAPRRNGPPICLSTIPAANGLGRRTTSHTGIFTPRLGQYSDRAYWPKAFLPVRFFTGGRHPPALIVIAIGFVNTGTDR
jgi:hypothetical protein